MKLPVKIYSIKVIRKAFSLLEARLRRVFIWLVCLAIITSALEAIGVSLAFGLIQLVMDPDLIGNFPRIKVWLNISDGSLNGRLLAFAAISMGIFFLSKNIFLAYSTYAQQRFTFEAAGMLARLLLSRYLGAPYERIFARNSADLIVSVNQSAYMVTSRIYSPTSVLMTEAFVIIAILGILLVTEPAVTLGAAIFMIMLFFIYHTIIAPFYGRWGAEQLNLEKKQTKYVYESLNCLREITVSGRQTFFLKNFINVRTRLVKLNALVATINMMPRLVTETIIVWAITVVIIISLKSDRGSTEIISTLGLFAFAGFRILPSMNRLAVAFSSLRSGEAAINSVIEDFEHFNEALELKPPLSNKPSLNFSSTIEARDLTYTYPGEDMPAVDRISFRIERLESIGIVGGTGAGKTTLIDILLGLHEPQTGSLLLDGQNLDTKALEWKRLIGYVPQDIALIDDTLRRNIALGIEDYRIDEKAIARAVQMAALSSVVAELPDGIETIIGEHGIRLSGGQRQRIGIARALYLDPKILIMDESTSSLDTQTEYEIVSAIEALSESKTIITIAHRLSTVRHCSQLFFMKGGRILDIGNFDEICERNAEFARMVEFAKLTRGSLDNSLAVPRS
tara:strand:- start:1399 stop:3264 length:1866 start_codon:yes stop_codon:yes gene_type:complete